MRFAVHTILQNLMEQSREPDMHLEQVRIRDQTSPATSSESDKGVDLSEQAPMAARKRHRRGKHRRKWKPYSSMSLEEKKAVEAKETARAARRESMLAGKPSAPWNTTQFIMEDRGCKEVRIPTPRASRTLSLEDSLSDDDVYESPEDELFEQSSLLEQDFESTYQEVAAERLQGLSKAELVEECLGLERDLHGAQDQGREEATRMQVQVENMQDQLLKLENKNLELQAQHKLNSHQMV